MIYLQTILGLVILLCGAEVLVRGAVYIARSFGISHLVIGMTIVAFGTSAPELVVVLDAVVLESEGLALGSLIGSNIANILLVLGASTLVIRGGPEISVDRSDIIFLTGGTLVFVLLSVFGTLDLGAGVILFGVFTAFLIQSFRKHLPSRSAATHTENTFHSTLFKKIFAGLSVIIGVGAVLWGANQMVQGCVEIARSLHVSEEVIGLTMVALGTSLPELATSFVAAARGNLEMAVGNILGSNLFNLLGIGGLAAIISPLPVPPQLLLFDIWVMLGATILLVPFLMGRWHLRPHVGAVFFAGYLAYIGLQAVGVGGMLE
ncbi:MAG: calcium/sodium antiporter [Rhodospirillaceae bacterium]|jgi:cation:H+ antiporter|nr:calcium/sodium antiporter [Rhodospirillales bacterium]MBT3906227.1 calcium/sodium antiporter [Rhodospirillaceae bacterium]MBT4702255.1 calcium/sodium antiporter [Rhodospirillaceae bacterium]MBT5033623.1 calcium/sodium antiporter [Rhodospirillaceae bacterium]MBT6221502.1 calcium/sodium antiporter [Rhodospirillaceae bacterium]